MKVLCKRDFTPFYKEHGSWGNHHHGEQAEGTKEQPNEYQIGNVYNQPSERVELKDFLSNTIKKGEPVDQDLIRSQYSVLHTPNGICTLKNLRVRPHPVVACYCTAYSEHYPLIVSPDHIWMMITQGLVKHLAVRPELLRSSENDQKPVKKMDIAVQMPKYITDPTSMEINWEGVVDEIQQAIINDVSQNADAKKQQLLDFLDHNFSTSTRVEKVASKILMMEAFKDYYTYQNDFLCGLPSVTILGTMEDWIGMREKIQVLDEYDMKWWRKVLTLIIDKIIKTAQEETLTEELKLFWNGIAVFDSGSGVDYISGWINYFFPYDKDNRISPHFSQFIEMDAKFDENVPYVENFEPCDLYEVCDEENEIKTAKMVKQLNWRQAFEQSWFPSPLTTTPVQVVNHECSKYGHFVDPICAETILECCSADDLTEMLSKYVTNKCNWEISEHITKKCEKAKIDLSKHNSTIIELSHSNTMTITREEFEEACAPILEQFEASLKNYILQSLEPPKTKEYRRVPNIEFAVFTGGTCNIPKVQNIIRKVVVEIVPNVTFVSHTMELSHVPSAAGSHYFRYNHYESLQYREKIKQMGYEDTTFY
ncbi:hypothetical protein C9374_009046 [Naegleria lovaniensis]|uniref:Uncharacterized protein n=1 Tax=Naegleria lovaniensis TaxID=51637 RepID=A0AA88KF61_NAELO|nr:uncharacterized protein C9374_009046 [Naegleria lovaniensis]KAG2377530.1 hypothetical protein C9374_009046 [Naegleria lovaniensis]